MPIALNKEQIRLNEELLSAEQQLTVQQDIIVPDTKPDIGKILQMDASVGICVKRAAEGNVSLGGNVFVTALYMGEGSGLQSIMVTIPVERTVNMPHLAADQPVLCEAIVENTEYNVINSRKLSVKVVIHADLSASVQGAGEITVGAPEGFEVQTGEICGFTSVADREAEIVIRENLEIPTTKPSIHEILKLDVKVRGSFVKVVENKVIAKGQLAVNTLYLSEDGGVHFIENEIPFTEILDADGAGEDMTCDLRYALREKLYEVREDSDGDPRVLNIDLLLGVHMRVEKEQRFSAVTDLYHTEKCIEVKTEEHSLYRPVAKGVYPISVKETVNISRDQPEVSEVYNMMATPVITEISESDGSMQIGGMIDTCILYLTDLPENPVCSHRCEVPFRETIEIPGMNSDSLCDLSSELEHISFHLTDPFTLELRYNINFLARVIQPVTFRSISAAEEAEIPEDSRPSVCSIRIYFVQKNDTLWDIAKRYRITVERLMEWNEMDERTKLYPGMQIIIP